MAAERPETIADGTPCDLVVAEQAVAEKQNDDQQSNKLPLPFALNFSILMTSKPMVMLAKAISFLHTLLKKRPRCPLHVVRSGHGNG